MPHFQLPHSVSLYYERHDISPGLPTLMILAPSWLDLTFCEESLTLNDELKAKYNIVGIELRNHGRSECAFSAVYDHFVGASDLALLMDELKLPPSHIFAAGAFGAAVALKFALIFPDLVCSLAIVGARGMFAEPTNKQALDELMIAWAEPVDEDEWNEAVESRAMMSFTDPEAHPEAADSFMNLFVERYGRNNLLKMLHVSLPNHRHPKLSPPQTELFTHPILLMHGVEDLIYPIDSVKEVADALVNAQVEFHAIEGGPHMCFLTHADVVLPIVRRFLLDQAHINEPIVPVRMMDGLSKLADIAGDATIAERDPNDPESFNLLDAEEVAHAQSLIDKWSVLESENHSRSASSASDEHDDEPAWSYSTRHEYAHMLANSRLTQKRPSITEESIVVDVREATVAGYKSRRASMLNDADAPTDASKIGRPASSDLSPLIVI
ncbi:hypothetical protein OIO90_005012 [Microbotryomycetes sp. JL221]|nr:hypothetical protein OIO90_005012 [Microbotryomycetes sp. JL221]